MLRRSAKNMEPLIKQNAQHIRDLHKKMHTAFHVKPHSIEHKQACDKFHSSYDSLAFPGGYELGIKKLTNCDSSTIETALCFLEVKPYFFRSQYMRTKLTRLLKKVELTKAQQTRFNKILKR